MFADKRISLWTRSHGNEAGIFSQEKLEMAECPVCGGEVELESDPVVGELLECPDCGSELEVLQIDPLNLGEAPETEEDCGGGQKTLASLPSV